MKAERIAALRKYAADPVSSRCLSGREVAECLDAIEALQKTLGIHHARECADVVHNSHLVQERDRYRAILQDIWDCYPGYMQRGDIGKWVASALGINYAEAFSGTPYSQHDDEVVRLRAEADRYRAALEEIAKPLDRNVHGLISRKRIDAEIAREALELI